MSILRAAHGHGTRAARGLVKNVKKSLKISKKKNVRAHGLGSAYELVNSRQARLVINEPRAVLILLSLLSSLYIRRIEWYFIQNKWSESVY